ncbi:AAA family ATPase [Thermovenabulum sp.]|uniref:AAA family ATPase n=1 Tax=Thermovenabulum sp. TaxID=3100335 RepID=UPI003C7A77D9
MRGKERRYFPGTSTPYGYLPFFSNVISWKEAKKIYVLKGGPGTGKSTFLGKLGERLLEEGYDVEFLHCSADSNSLDGIYLAKEGIALVDGTAPHVIDPNFPGAVDVIINLGDYWSANILIKNKDEIINLQEQIKDCYLHAFTHLKIAKACYDEVESIYIKAVKKLEFQRFLNEFIYDVFKDKQAAHKIPKVRKMFASSITPEGKVNFIKNLFDPLKYKYIFTSASGELVNEVLKAIRDRALMLGYNIEEFHCPVTTEKIDHLILPEISLGFVTSKEPHLYSEPVGNIKLVNLDNYIDFNKINQNKFVKLASERIINALDEAVEGMKEAKHLHDDLEKFYIESMNFNRIDKLLEDIYEDIIKNIDQK